MKTHSNKGTCDWKQTSIGLIWTPVSFLHAIDVSIRDDCNRGQPQLGIIQWPRNIVPNGMIISIWCLKSSSRIFYDLFLCNWKKCMANLYRLYIPYMDGWGVTTTGFSETPMTATCTRPYRDLKIHGDPWQNLVNPYPQLGCMENGIFTYMNGLILWYINR